MTNECNECKECMFAGCGCITIMAFVAGCIAYYVFAIMALINEYHEPFSKMCNCTSHIWVYMLVFIIYNLIYANHINKVLYDKSSTLEKIAALSVVGLIELGLISWGWWELHQPGAYSTLHHLMLYKLVQVMVYMHTTILGIFTIIIVLNLIDVCENMCCCCSSSDTPVSTPVPTVMSSTTIINIEPPHDDNSTTVFDTQTDYTKATSPKPIPTIDMTDTSPA